MVRQDRWKLVVTRPDLVAVHLYDLAADPYELNNLVADDEQAPVRKRLLQMVRDWHDRVTSRFRHFAVPALQGSCSVRRVAGAAVPNPPLPPRAIGDTEGGRSGRCSREQARKRGGRSRPLLRWMITSERRRDPCS